MGQGMRGAPCDYEPASRKHPHPTLTPPWAPGFPGETIEMAGETKDGAGDPYKTPSPSGTSYANPLSQRERVRVREKRELDISS